MARRALLALIAGVLTCAAVCLAGCGGSATDESSRGATPSTARAYVAWAVGDHGTILATDGSGETWDVLSSGTTADLTSVDFIDALHGWVVGTTGLVGQTSDGGETWSLQRVTGDSTLEAIAAGDADHAWAVSDEGRIFATADGGATWAGQYHAAGVGLMSVSATDADHAWAVGECGTILSTSDGGATWRDRTPANMDCTMLWDVAFATSKCGWAVGSWTTASREVGVVLRTTDGGATWTKETAPGLATTYGGVACRGTSHAWVVGSWSGAGVLMTTNGGRRWSRGGFAVRDHGNSTEASGVVFANTEDGWVVGRTKVGWAGTTGRSWIMASHDGGRSWTRQTTHSKYPLMGVCALGE